MDAVGSPTDELPIYTEPGEGTARTAAVGFDARALAGRVRRAATSAAQGTASPTAAARWRADENQSSLPIGERPSMAVVRHLLVDPDRALAGFDRWWADHPARIQVRFATLRLRGARPAAHRQMRLVRGRMWLHTSVAPVPVEIEFAACGRAHVVVSLRPTRHAWNSIGLQRRWAWFAAGHASLEQISTAVRGYCDARIPAGEPAPLPSERGSTGRDVCNEACQHSG